MSQTSTVTIYLPFDAIVVFIAFTASDGIQKSVHNRYSHSISWYRHRTARSPIIFDRVVLIHPIGVVTVTRTVVSTAHCVKNTLKCKSFTSLIVNTITYKNIDVKSHICQCHHSKLSNVSYLSNIKGNYNYTKPLVVPLKKRRQVRIWVLLA